MNNELTVDSLLEKRAKDLNYLDFKLSLREVVWDTKKQMAFLKGIKEARRSLSHFAQGQLTLNDIEDFRDILTRMGTYESLLRDMLGDAADGYIYTEA